MTENALQTRPAVAHSGPREAANNRTSKLAARLEAAQERASRRRLDNVVFRLKIGADVNARPANMLHTPKASSRFAVGRLTRVCRSICRTTSVIKPQTTDVKMVGFQCPRVRENFQAQFAFQDGNRCSYCNRKLKKFDGARCQKVMGDTYISQRSEELRA
jgi:hypothetical protein